MDESLLILEQILELVQKLEMPERRWLLERLEAVECNPAWVQPKGRKVEQATDAEPGPEAADEAA